MKKIRYIAVVCIACLWCSCYQEALFEDNFLNEESVTDVGPYTFCFDALFPITNGGLVSGRSGVYYLNENQSGMLQYPGQDLMDKSEILSKMCRQLYEKNIRIRCAIDPKMWGGKYADKEAFFNSWDNIIYFKSEGGIMDQRIILHELLHAFQVHLANVKYTPENESQTEFEVLLMYDVFHYKMYKSFSIEGGSSKEYQNFVMQIADFQLSAGNDYEQGRLMEMFEEHYKRWANISSTTEVSHYYPSLLYYFLIPLGYN